MVRALPGPGELEGMNPPASLALQTILVPTDFSRPADDALRSAEQFAAASGARLVLLHCIPTALPAGAVGASLATAGLLASHQAHARNVATDHLAEAARASCARGSRTEALLCDGVPAQQITQAAASLAADLVVLSTHGRRGWQRLLLGSVAEQVVRHSPCPILCLHSHPDPHARPAAAGATGLAAAPLQLRRVLFTTDFSPAAGAAFPWAERLCVAAGAELTVLHVVAPENETAIPPVVTPGPPDAALESFQSDLRRNLAESLGHWCEQAKAQHCQAAPLLLHGAPPEQICEAAHNTRADLIVLAAQGASSWDRALLGSTAERVIRSAACPVLVVPARRPT